MKSLSDETRFAIIKMLLSHDYCVGGLARILGISEAAVSQHLKILKEAGIIIGSKSGYFMHYHVKQDALQYLANSIVELTAVDQLSIAQCHPHDKAGCRLCSISNLVR